MCEECYSDKNRITPLYNIYQCLKNHTQYICGTCDHYICIESRKGLRRWNFSFKSINEAKLYLRTADYTMKKSCSIYEIKNSKRRIYYKIFTDDKDLEIYLKKNQDKSGDYLTPIYIKDEYQEFPNMQIRKLTDEEMQQYLSKR